MTREEMNVQAEALLKAIEAEIASLKPLVAATKARNARMMADYRAGIRTPDTEESRAQYNLGASQAMYLRHLYQIRDKQRTWVDSFKG
jgi:hypothetical protein